MKTLSRVQSEIKEIQDTTYDREVKSEVRQYKKDMQRLSLLKHILAYLKTNPTEAFVKAEQERLFNLISAVNDRYALPENADQIEKKTLAKHKKEFEASYGIPKLRSQLKTINFLLSK